MHVHDGTTPGILYPDIICMKNSPSCISNPTTPRLEDKNETSLFTPDDPFFYVKFEHNPIDEWADNALTVKTNGDGSHISWWLSRRDICIS